MGHASERTPLRFSTQEAPSSRPPPPREFWQMSSRVAPTRQDKRLLTGPVARSAPSYEDSFVTAPMTPLPSRVPWEASSFASPSAPPSGMSPTPVRHYIVPAGPSPFHSLPPPVFHVRVAAGERADRRARRRFIGAVVWGFVLYIAISIAVTLVVSDWEGVRNNWEGVKEIARDRWRDFERWLKAQEARMPGQSMEEVPDRKAYRESFGDQVNGDPSGCVSQYSADTFGPS